MVSRKNIECKSVVIPKLHKAFKSNKIKGHDVEILAVGRLNSVKCYNILIKSLCLVHLKYPSVKLVIYGDGPLRNNLKTLVDQLSLSRYVYFKGFVGNPFNKQSMN